MQQYRRKHRFIRINEYDKRIYSVRDKIKKTASKIKENNYQTRAHGYFEMRENKISTRPSAVAMNTIAQSSWGVESFGAAVRVRIGKTLPTRARVHPFGNARRAKERLSLSPSTPSPPTSLLVPNPLSYPFAAVRLSVPRHHRPTVLPFFHQFQLYPITSIGCPSIHTP